MSFRTNRILWLNEKWWNSDPISTLQSSCDTPRPPQREDWCLFNISGFLPPFRIWFLPTVILNMCICLSFFSSASMPSRSIIVLQEIRKLYSETLTFSWPPQTHFSKLTLLHIISVSITPSAYGSWMIMVMVNLPSAFPHVFLHHTCFL